MTANQLRDTLRKMKWTQRELAERLSISERHVRRYLAEDAPITKVVEYAIRWVTQ